MWVDEVTGRQLHNPFDQKNPDLKGQTVLMKRDERLAKHLKAMAEDAYGTLAQLIDDQVGAGSVSEHPLRLGDS